MKHSPFSIGWKLWKSRNYLIFNKITMEPISIINKAQGDVVEWLAGKDTSRQKEKTTTQTSRYSQQVHWSPPPAGYYKINYDGSFISPHGNIEVGWVIRDDKGMYVRQF